MGRKEMKLKSKVRTLIATTLLSTASQLFAAEATYYVGTDIAPQSPANGNHANFSTFHDFLRVPANAADDDATGNADGVLYDPTTDPVPVPRYNIEDSRSCTVSGIVDGKSFTAIFTTSADPGIVGLRQERSIGVDSNDALSNNASITFTFSGFDDDGNGTVDGQSSATGVSFDGFTELGIYSNGNRNLKINGSSNVIVPTTQSNTVDLTVYDGTAQDTSTNLTAARASGTHFPTQIALKFSTAAAPEEITGYTAPSDPFAGSTQHPVFATASEVETVLGTELTASTASGNVQVPVTWSSSYSTDAGTYTFTATPTPPAGYVDNIANTPANVTVDVVVAKADYVTTDVELDDAVFGFQSNVPQFDEVFGTLDSDTETGSLYIVLNNGEVEETLYKIDLTVTATDTDGPTTVATASAESVRLGVHGETGSTNAFIENTESLKIEVTDITVDGQPTNKLFGFKTMFVGNATGNKGFITDKDSTQVNVATASALSIDFSDSNTFNGNLPTQFVQINGVDGGGMINYITFDFAGSTLTPALGVEVEQTDTLVTWSVQEEINVKGYKLVKKGTTEVVAFVDYDADKGGQYELDLVDYDGLVDLIVVDNDGKESNPYSPENGNEVTGNYNLVEGWNLISVPGDNADLSAVEAATVGTLWGWDGSKYVETDGQTAYEGIWVYATETATVTAPAIKAATTLDIEAGWTLAGPVNTVEVPENVNVFSWNGTYSPTVSIDMGVGYWFFTPKATTIILDID